MNREIHQTDEGILDRIRPCFVGTFIIFLVTFAVVYLSLGTATGSDYAVHSNWAMQLGYHLWSFMKNTISYPAWHFVTKALFKLFSFSEVGCAAIATALFNCFAYWCILYVWNFLARIPCQMKDRAFWGVVLLVVGPLWIPGINLNYYYGQGGGNVWHSPTHIAVKGLAIFCFVYIIRLLEEKEKINKRQYILLSAALLASALAKPSFLQAMIPGLGLYFILVLIRDGWKKNIVRFVTVASAFIPSVCLLAVQFVQNFYSDTMIHEASGIGIEYGKFLHLFSPNLFYSFVMAFGFPLFVMAMDFKRLWKETPVQVAGCYGLCSWLEAAFLYEKGVRWDHGNWTWGYNLAQLVLWVLFTVRFFDLIREEGISRRKRNLCLFVGMPLLFLHLFFGFVWWCNLLKGVGLLYYRNG